MGMRANESQWVTKMNSTQHMLLMDMAGSKAFLDAVRLFFLELLIVY
jgi:hypothetical protein